MEFGLFTLIGPFVVMTFCCFMRVSSVPRTLFVALPA